MSKIYGLNEIIHGDCLLHMKNIPSQSIDMILCDLPYGISNCSWDKVIPFDELWFQYKRIVKENGAIALFAQQPFATDLIHSNRSWFRYEWIWEKSRALGYYNSKRMPLRCHENILVFYKKLPTYHPQFTKGKPYTRESVSHAKVYRPREQKAKIMENPGIRYPRDVIYMASHVGHTDHPTQKPVKLLKYLIKTYTNPGDIVLDNCMGSGSTAVAAIETGRNFIGIDIEKEYVEKAKARCQKAYEKVAELQENSEQAK